MAVKSKDFILFLIFGVSVASLFLFGVWWFILEPSLEGQSKVRAEARLKPVKVPSVVNSPSANSAPKDKGGRALRTKTRRAKGRFVQQKLGNGIGTSEEEKDSDTTTPSEGDNSEELDNEVNRVDQNAQRFDGWMETYDAELESGLLDKKATQRFEAELGELLANVPMETNAQVQCTETVCEVELSSGVGLGPLLPHVTGWMIDQPSYAHGHQRTPLGGLVDEAVETSRKGLRVFFDNQSNLPDEEASLEEASSESSVELQVQPHELVD